MIHGRPQEGFKYLYLTTPYKDLMPPFFKKRKKLGLNEEWEKKY